jgi:hypothetical protein
MEDKLENHGDTLESHNRRLGDLTTSLHENTQLTQQIADNTSEMVTMFKEAKVVFKWGSAAKSFLIWLGSFLAGLYYFWDSILDWFKR